MSGERGDRVRGFVLTSRRDWVCTAHGRAAWERVLLSLPVSVQQTLRGELSATAWYPLGTTEALDWALCQTFGGGKPRFFRTLGAHSAQLLVPTRFPIPYRRRQPLGFLREVCRRAPAYFEGLAVELQERTPTDVVLIFSGITSNVTNCESNLGYYAKGIELCGGTEVQVSEGSCTAKGAPQCRYGFRWRGRGPTTVIGSD